MKKLIATATAFGGSLYMLALPVLATEIKLCDTSSPISKAMCGLTIPGILKGGISLILIIALVLAFVFLVIGGIKWILSGGDKAGTEAAKGTLTAAILGLIVVFLAWVLLTFVGGFFGLDVAQTFTLPTAQ